MGNNVVELDGVYLEFPEDMENVKVDNKPSEVDMVEEIPIQTEEQKQKTTIILLISIISVLVLLIVIGIFLKIRKLF